MNEQTETAHQLGSLAAEVRALSRNLSQDREDRHKVDDEAAAQRLLTQKKLDMLERTQRDLVRRVDEIEPVAKMVSSWQMRWTGAVIVFGLLGTVATTGWVFFKTQILQLFNSK